MKTKNNTITLDVDELITLSLCRHFFSEREDDVDNDIFLKNHPSLPAGMPLSLSHTWSVGPCVFTLKGTADRVTEDGLFLLAYAPAPHQQDVHTEKSPNMIQNEKEDASAPIPVSAAVRRRARGKAYLLAYCYRKMHQHDAEKAVAPLSLHIIYIDQFGMTIFTEDETPSDHALDAFFQKTTQALSGYARPTSERSALRLPSMEALRFPFSERRMGQGELMQAVYKTIRRGGRLYASAPTGIGKTMSVLYPAVRALGEGHLEKIFYFTPKSTVAQAAADAIEHLCKKGAHIRAVRLYAKETLCKCDTICHENTTACPRFVRSRKGCEKAVEALFALNLPVVDASAISRIADAFGVCPHELSLCYSELADVVIGDYNYLFDPRIALKRFFSQKGEYAFLIDEAHNLIDRGRDTYSAAISTAHFTDLCLIADEHCAPLSASVHEAHAFFQKELSLQLEDVTKKDADGHVYAYDRRRLPPEEIIRQVNALLDAVATLEKHSKLDANVRKKLRHALSPFRDFAAKAATYDDDCVSLLSRDNDTYRLRLFCINPAKRLVERMEKGRATVLFSATLEPLHYYKSVLGADGTSMELSLPSPFPEEHLGIAVMDGISLRYADRGSTLSDICRAVICTVNARRGNYLIFCPSFAYLDALSNLFEAQMKTVRVLRQLPNMTRRDRADYLKNFTPDATVPVVGFAVMGGVFSESVDLTGERLVGSVVIGVGLPGPSEEREACAAYYDERCDGGREYAYLYPGMNRVLQAAGRVIRTEKDRGVLVLIDDRFRDPFYRAMIPTHFRHLRFAGNQKALEELLRRFWNDGSLLPKGFS